MNNELAERLADVPDFDEDESLLERPAPPREPSQVYSLRIPVKKLKLLRHVAAEHNATPSALMRRWVLERLEAIAPDGQPQSSYHLGDDLVNRVIDLEQQVAVHQKALEQQAQVHQKELETVANSVANSVIGKVIEAMTKQFDIRPKRS
jgi:hypothetical protein